MFVICDFCFRPTKTIITNVQNIDRIVNSLNTISIRNPITFTGGEPFVSPYLPYVVDRLRDSGFNLSFHTNGLALEQTDVVSF